MSESPAAASCPACGAEAPADAAFCPACGARLDTGATERGELPPDETGRVPVSVVQVEPRLFGVTPPTLLFSLAAVALTVGGVLVGLGHWPWALLLFAFGLVLLVAFLRVARRKPDAALARTSVGAVDSIRARAGYAAQALRTRSTARREVLRLRADLLRIDTRREETLRDLGSAVFRNDRAAVKGLKAELGDLEERAAGLQAEIRHVVESAQQQISRAALEVQPTEIRPDSRPRAQD